MSREGAATGRAIKFIQASSTELPVRDIPGRRKTEPYIEYGWERGLNEDYIVGAENFCSRCYPDAVQKLVNENREYLFLVTYPKHRGSTVNENHIIGYIRNEDYEWREEDRVAVIGEIKLFSEEDGIPLSDFGYEPSKRSLSPWGYPFDEEDTAEIISRFEGSDDLTEECLEKVLEWEGKNRTSSTDRGC